MKDVIRQGRKFFIEVYYPEHKKKFLGVAMKINFNDKPIEVFVTHIKRPEKHFYIHEQGYPVNEELLKMLVNARINYVIIPEDGKTGFSCYIATTTDILNGASIKQPHVERQCVIPLKQMKKIEIKRDILEKNLY